MLKVWLSFWGGGGTICIINTYTSINLTFPPPVKPLEADDVHTLGVGTVRPASKHRVPEPTFDPRTPSGLDEHHDARWRAVCRWCPSGRRWPGRADEVGVWSMPRSTWRGRNLILALLGRTISIFLFPKSSSSLTGILCNELFLDCAWR